MYLYVIRWKGGSLFPTEQELKNPPFDGIYKTKVKGTRVHSNLEGLLRKCTTRLEKLGSHMMRKTGYMWATLGKARDSVSMMLAAGHASVGVALKYFQDCLSLVDQMPPEDRAIQSVGTWHSCHSKGGETAVLIAKRSKDSGMQSGLPALVTGFMEGIIGVCRDSNGNLVDSISEIHKRVLEWQPVGKNTARSQLEVSTTRSIDVTFH